MKKVLFFAVTVMIFFNSCDKINTGKGDGVSQKGEECFSSLDCEKDQICVNGYCVDNKSTEEDDPSGSGSFIQNISEPYCEKYQECEPEEFSYSFNDIDECVEDFISEMTDWYEDQTTDCINDYESLMTCYSQLECSYFNNHSPDSPCYQQLINYFNSCEDEEENDEESVCSEGEVKCENNIFMWCEDGDWKGIGCADYEVCDESRGCVTEDLF